MHGDQIACGCAVGLGKPAGAALRVGDQRMQEALNARTFESANMLECPIFLDERGENGDVGALGTSNIRRHVDAGELARRLRFSSNHEPDAGRLGGSGESTGIGR